MSDELSAVNSEQEADYDKEYEKSLLLLLHLVSISDLVA